MLKIERKQRSGFGSLTTGKETSILEGTVVGAFFPEVVGMTIKEIIGRTGRSYERINSALKSLAEKKIVREEKIGKTLVYYLDVQSFSFYPGFLSYTLEREIDFINKHKILYGAIKEMEANPYIWMVVLFGSYSKGTESKNSDVDVICVSNNKEETERFVKSLRYKYNLKFAPVVLPLHEFPNIKKDNPELWEDLKLYGIAFKGGDSFHYWMYKNG